MKPEKWADPAKKLFPHQVGFTGPPMDFDAAPSDFLRIAPPTVGAHGRLLHAPGYAHQLDQRVDNFHQLALRLLHRGDVFVGRTLLAGGKSLRRALREASEKTAAHWVGVWRC